MEVPLFRSLQPKLALPPTVVVVVVATYVFFDTVVFSLFAPGTDWAPLWVAGGLAWTDPLLAYDFGYVTQLQGPLAVPGSDRPFVYPPTSLLLFAPLGLLSFHASLAAFVAASLFMFARVSSRLGSRPVLLWLAPPVVLAAVAGQPTLAVAALAVAALLDLPSNERRAGVLLGIAAVLKPPLLLLAPFALVGGRHWRALEAAGATVAAVVAASVFLFGIETWKAWFTVLPQFQALVTGFEPLLRNTLSPHSAVLRLGYDPGWTILAVALVAIPLTILTFARSRDVSLRLVMLIGGALLITPYGMHYELAALAPAVAAMPLRRMRDAAIPGIWATSLFLNASVIGLLAVYCWAAARLFAVLRADNVPVQTRVDVAA